MGVMSYLKTKLISSIGGSMMLNYVAGNMVEWFGQSRASMLKNGYARNVHVFTATNVYLNKAKVAPFLLNKVKNERKAIKYEQFIRSKDDSHRLEALMLKEQAFEEIEDHHLLSLLNNPNTYQTASEFRESILGFYKTLGEAFVYGIGPLSGPNAGKFKELHVISPTMIEPVFSNKMLDPISHYQLDLDGQAVRIEKENIMHFKKWNPLNPLRGLSSAEVGLKTLKRNESNHTAMTKAFQNGGVAHMLSSEGGVALDQTQMDLINQRLMAKLQGPENYHNILATNGMVKATKIGESPADLKLIESDVHDRGIIAAMLGIDPILVGDKNGSSFANQEQAYKALVTNLIMPDLITLGENLSAWLLPRYKGEKLHLSFDTTVYSELAPDLKLLVSVYGQPLLTENEKRSVFNWDADKTPGMDDIYIKSGLIPMSRIGELDLNRSQANAGNNPNAPVE